MITVALLGFAGTAAAGWTPVRNLSTGTTDSFEPTVAVAPNGTATAVWTLDTGPGQDARARRLPLTGTPGPLRNLLVSNSAPDVAVTPQGISFEVPTNTEIVVKGVDKQQVGQTAAEIRKTRPPEPYKGKGIRYAGEYVRRKVGKRA